MTLLDSSHRFLHLQLALDAELLQVIPKFMDDGCQRHP
jgi:hypothetical protein